MKIYDYVFVAVHNGEMTSLTGVHGHLLAKDDNDFYMKIGALHPEIAQDDGVEVRYCCPFRA